MLCSAAVFWLAPKRATPGSMARALVFLLGSASALRLAAGPPQLHRPAAPPPLRARAILNSEPEPDDTLVFYGDALFCVLYGAVQGAIDSDPI